MVDICHLDPPQQAQLLVLGKLRRRAVEEQRRHH